MSFGAMCWTPSLLHHSHWAAAAAAKKPLNVLAHLLSVVLLPQTPAASRFYYICLVQHQILWSVRLLHNDSSFPQMCHLVSLYSSGLKRRVCFPCRKRCKPGGGKKTNKHVENCSLCLDQRLSRGLNACYSLARPKQTATWLWCTHIQL